MGAALFVIGLSICLWRWKRPAYALILLWFFISLIPAMVTPFSPNFVRTIASWPTPFVFVGLAMSENVQWVIKRQSAFRNPHLVVGAFVVILGYNAWLTERDYFGEWPTGDYVRFWQQAAWTQAVRDLNADPANTPIAASGLSVQDFDPQTFDLLGLRSDLKVKWFDCRNAMLYPQDGAPTRYLIPAYLPCDAELQARFWTGAQVLIRPHWPDTHEAVFTLHDLDGQAALAAALTGAARRPAWIGGETFDRRHPAIDLQPAHLPFELGGLNLLGWDTDRDTVKAGETIDLFTYWEMAEPSAAPLKIFMHLTAPDGQIVAQWDGVDVGIGSLEAHDLFVQRHHFALPGDLAAGSYRLSIGAYHPDSGERLKA